MKVRYNRNDSNVYGDTKIMLMDPKQSNIEMLMGILIWISQKSDPKIRQN